uniref:HD domain-containing protein n=1 Tax=Chitinophaga tropicalis TaxID=2683588 RepID=UPI0018E01CC9|nr:ATP-binding protein [Chitinophaga tropicalis]
MDALWETASLIIGEDFPLTPLEGFVLGGAILLHDSALCFEAYEGGMDGLRETDQWKDAYVDFKESAELSDEEIRHMADFSTLRNLHASQAEKLLERKWNFSGSDDFFLLENQVLRIHLGELIGKLASSHHWDLENVVASFNTQVNALAQFPREWRIDPIKIACILRCADAAHIDNERAPDFLMALLKISGMSLDHWKAQNRLAKVDIDQNGKDRDMLLFTSTVGFKEEDAKAWFVAYDAINLVDKELRACNNLLEDRIEGGFQVKSVKGVDSPKVLSQYVKTDGWQPNSSMLHVSNIEKLITNLGGEMLYGVASNQLEIVIRELIQNARDAVKARESYDKGVSSKVSIKIIAEGNDIWLILEDNGIGMSERVLTGPLLDFGTSFWTSSLIQSEFPGLRSSKYRSIGKFGIGFYSIFMISDQVHVASRNFNLGIHEVKTLKFNTGLTLRPILSRGRPEDFGSSISTQIKVKLKPHIIDKDLMVEVKPGLADIADFRMPLDKFIASLAVGLDIDLFYSFDKEEERIIHRSVSKLIADRSIEAVGAWLKDISLLGFGSYFESSNNLNNVIERLEPIINNEILCGFAAINTLPDRHSGFMGIKAIGGLALSAQGRHDQFIVGYINYIPNSAKRDEGKFSAPVDVLQNWASRQLALLLKQTLLPEERYYSASALCQFKIDPSPIATVPLLAEGTLIYKDIDELAIEAKYKSIIFLLSGFNGQFIEAFHNVTGVPNALIVKPLSTGDFISVVLENGIPRNDYSILDCLYRRILANNLRPIIVKRENVCSNLFGKPVNALMISAE